MSLFRRGILQKTTTGGGTGSGILGEVNTFSDLPISASIGDRYLVLTYSISTPTKLKGVYRWNGSAWDRQSGARAFDVIYDNSGSTLTSINLEASTNELDAKVNGKAASNDSRFDNHLSSFTQNSGQYIATEGVRARDVGGIALLNNSGTAGVTVSDNGDIDIITKISAEELKARNVNGLKLYDDGGNGLFIKDGGNIGIGNNNPNTKIVIEGSNTKEGNGVTFRADQGGVASDRLSMYAEFGSTFTFNQPYDGVIRFTDHSGVDILHVSTWLQRVGVLNNNPKQKLSVGEDLGSSIGAFGIGAQGGVVTGSPNSNSVIGIQNWGAASKLFSFNYGTNQAVPIWIQPDNANVYICQNGGNVGIGTTNPSQRLHVNGNAIVSGSLSKGSGSFDIAHPDPKKTKTHRLRHYFVETPSAGGNIYKYQIECEVGNNYIDLPDYYQYLNKDSLVWVNPVKHFGRAWGEVEDNRKVKIVAEEKGIYNILVFGDRKDETAIKDFNKFGIEYKNKK